MMLTWGATSPVMLQEKKAGRAVIVLDQPPAAVAQPPWCEILLTLRDGSVFFWPGGRAGLGSMQCK